MFVEKECINNKKIIGEKFEKLITRLQSEVAGISAKKMFEHRSYFVNEFIEGLWQDNPTDCVEDTFFFFGTLWSFLDCSLLSNLILQFGSEELNSEMSQYHTCLSEFMKNTKVCDLFSLQLYDEKIPNYEIVEVKFFNSNMTLKSIEDFKNRFKCLEHSYYYKFMEGCVSVMWLIPLSLVSDFKNEVQSKNKILFAQYKVMKIMVADEDDPIFKHRALQGEINRIALYIAF